MLKFLWYIWCLCQLTWICNKIDSMKKVKSLFLSVCHRSSHFNLNFDFLLSEYVCGSPYSSHEFDSFILCTQWLFCICFFVSSKMVLLLMNKETFQDVYVYLVSPRLLLVKFLTVVKLTCDKQSFVWWVSAKGINDELLLFRFKCSRETYGYLINWILHLP